MFPTKRLQPIIMAAKSDGTIEYRPLVAEETSVGQLLMDIFLPRTDEEPTPTERKWRPLLLASQK